VKRNPSDHILGFLCKSS